MSTTTGGAEDEDTSRELAPLLSAPVVAGEDERKFTSDSDADAPVSPSHNSGFIHDAIQPTNRHYPMWVSIIFMLNYSIGSGVLGLPVEFYDTGYVLGILILAWCSVLTYASYKQVGNLIFRAEAVSFVATNFGLQKSDFLDAPDHIISQLRDNVAVADFVSRYETFYRNEFELNHLVGLFCGRRVRIAYDISFFLTQMIALWSYCALFGASLARMTGIPGISDSCNIESSDDEGCRVLYTIYVCIFWAWCVFLVLLDFTEQMGLQVASFAARLCILLLVIVTSIGLMYGDLEYSIDSGEYSERTSGSTPWYGGGGSGTEWKWGGLLYFIAVGSFAFGNQFCLPDVIEPLRRQDRVRQSRMVGVTVCSLFCIYAFVGVCVALYFGPDTEDPCTLAWKTFRGFDWGDGERPGWSYFVSYCVLLLPPVDLASSYPLNMITLANTIEQSVLDLERLRQDSAYFMKWKIVVRVSLVTITVILALLVWDFGFIIVLSGVCSLVALYLIPAYAEYKSQEMCRIITNDASAHITPVTDWSSSMVCIYAVVITAVVGIVGVFVELATDDY